jgi:hypothetical protein
LFTLLAVLLPGEKSTCIHWIGNWVGPRAGLDAESKENIFGPFQESIRNSSVFQHDCVLIDLSRLQYYVGIEFGLPLYDKT